MAMMTSLIRSQCLYPNLVVKHDRMSTLCVNKFIVNGLLSHLIIQLNNSALCMHIFIQINSNRHIPFPYSSTILSNELLETLKLLKFTWTAFFGLINSRNTNLNLWFLRPKKNGLNHKNGNILWSLFHFAGLCHSRTTKPLFLFTFCYHLERMSRIYLTEARWICDLFVQHFKTKHNIA